MVFFSLSLSFFFLAFEDRDISDVALFMIFIVSRETDLYSSSASLFSLNVESSNLSHGILRLESIFYGINRTHARTGFMDFIRHLDASA